MSETFCTRPKTIYMGFSVQDARLLGASIHRNLSKQPLYLGSFVAGSLGMTRDVGLAVQASLYRTLCTGFLREEPVDTSLYTRVSVIGRSTKERPSLHGASVHRTFPIQDPLYRGSCRTLYGSYSVQDLYVGPSVLGPLSRHIYIYIYLKRIFYKQESL